MQLSPDDHIWWRFGLFELNSTILFTWVVMALITVGSLAGDAEIAHGGAYLAGAACAGGGGSWHRSAASGDFAPSAQGVTSLPVGTLFLFIAVCNLLSIIPGFEPPTGSLSTSAGLAGCVFAAVPIYGIGEIGFGRYLQNYLRPTPFMLPFNIMGELSRTLALSVRLFGNVMSSSMIGGILLIIAPLDLSHPHAASGTLDGAGAGVHFCHSGGGLYQRGDGGGTMIGIGRKIFRPYLNKGETVWMH